MVKMKKMSARKRMTGKVRNFISKIQRREFQTPLKDEEFPIELNRTRALRRLERDVVGQEKKSDKEFDEAERDVFEDPREKNEGLGIEEDEEKGEYPYPEIEVAEKKDADEEEEE